MELNGRVVVDVEVDGVYSEDFPDFSDAYFSHAVFADTKEVLTDEQLEQLDEKFGDVLNQMAYESFL